MRRNVVAGIKIQPIYARKKYIECCWLSIISAANLPDTGESSMPQLKSILSASINHKERSCGRYGTSCFNSFRNIKQQQNV